MPDIPTFQRQSEAPLYPKVLWNRPVARTGAGRLLLPGGHTGAFSLVTGVYQAAMAAGAGECLPVLPDSLLKTLGGAPDTVFVEASPSGSLGREALGRILHLAEDTDVLMIGANLSNNSLTTILIERLLGESDRPAIAFADALVSLKHNLRALTGRKDGLLIVTMPEIFILAGALGVAISIREGGGLINKLEIIRDVAAASACDLAVYGSEVVVAAGGRLGVTPVDYRLSQLPALYYGTLAVFWTQNPAQRYEGLMTGAYLLGRVGAEVFDTAKSRPTLSDGTKAVARLLDASF